MTLTPKEVEHIALLARLDLTEDEKKCFQKQLSAILEHVAQLQKLDTTGIDASSSVQPTRTRLREDTVREGLKQQEALDNAPSAESNQFRVPPVME